ncbi:MAG: D-aminoacyl-tRNA deacylase [Bacillota bacterium]
MRAVVQRVSDANVTIDGRMVGEIRQGLTVLLGVGQGDTEQDAAYLCDKIVGLRVFEDTDGKMNLSLSDIGGGLLVVSQFTLYGDCRKGRRPSFSDAADPETARRLYEHFLSLARQHTVNVASGQFQATMQVNIHNDGPVTLLLDSRRAF